MKIKIAALVNYLAAILLMVMGIVYLTKPSFMAYHRDAISIDWTKLDVNIRVLILALMRGVSGGLIAVSVTILFLEYKFTSTRQQWIPLLIMIIGIILSGTIIYAMLMVRLNTPGHPPVAFTISGTVLLIIGFFLNRNVILKR